jgi:hypothetical protein
MTSHEGLRADELIRKALRERGELRLGARIVFVVWHQHADAPHALGLLGAHHCRPHRRAPEPRDECPSFH